MFWFNFVLLPLKSLIALLRATTLTSDRKGPKFTMLREWNISPETSDSLHLWLRMRSHVPWVAQVRNMWTDWYWCRVVLPLACLFQFWCPWSYHFCRSLKCYLNPNGGLGLRLKSMVIKIRKFWIEQCWCRDTLSLRCLFQPWSVELVGMVVVWTQTLTPNGSFLLRLRPLHHGWPR